MLSCWVTLNVSLAQTINADSLFLKARDYAFSGRYDDARRTSRELLSLYPNYNDAILLIGKTYVWEHKSDLARMTLIPLLDITPDSHEVLTLLIDNAIEEKKYDEAISYANRALVYYPVDTEILYRKANAIFLRGEKAAANEVIDQIFAISPNHAGAMELKEIMATSGGHLYLQAAEDVKNGKYKQARDTLRKILVENPDHFDASLLMAYAYGWEGKYDSARLFTQQLVKINPNNNELLNLMVHVEIWDKKYKTALALVNKAMDIYPVDQNFMYQKARIQYEMQDYQDALKSLEQLLAVNSNHDDGNKLYQLIKDCHMYQDYVFLENYYEFAEKPYISRKLVQSIGLAKKEKFGTFIAKVNIGKRLSPLEKDLGFQYELEAYPKLTSTQYLYLNYAFSQNLFFPNHRTAFEFFQRLPKGFEASLGIRTIYWTSMNWIYTGSISLLSHKHYIAFRPYFSHTNRWTDSYILTYRYYFNTEREDYMYLLAGFGSYSDNFLQLNPKPGDSYMVQLGMLKFINPRWNLQVSAGYNYDDGFRDRWQGMVGLRYYFNMFRR